MDYAYGDRKTGVDELTRPKQPRFRPTFQPTFSVPVPLVRRRDLVDYGDGLFLWRGAVTLSELPPELYLRGLRDLDASDDGAVVDFVRTHGVIDSPWDAPTEFYDKAFASQQVVDRRSRDITDLKESGERVAGTTTYDLSNTLRLMQVLVDHWLLYEDADDPGAAWTEITPYRRKEDRLHSAWQQWTRLMNGMVNQGAMTINVDYPGGSFGPTGVELQHALAVQLFNHCTEGIPARVCAKCGKRFVRQQGRGEGEKNWTTVSVKYCTSKCKNADWQRKYRAGETGQKSKSRET